MVRLTLIERQLSTIWVSSRIAATEVAGVANRAVVACCTAMKALASPMRALAGPGW
jgi:hypothetical protein